MALIGPNPFKMLRRGGGLGLAWDGLTGLGTVDGPNPFGPLGNYG